MDILFLSLKEHFLAFSVQIPNYKVHSQKNVLFSKLVLVSPRKFQRSCMSCVVILITNKLTIPIIIIVILMILIIIIIIIIIIITVAKVLLIIEVVV